jgi:putative FmdB family regulatory protein
VPFYEYACDACELIYKTRHGISEPGPSHCPKCNNALRKVISAPSLNIHGYTSPTEAKYANLSLSDELKKEKELQKVYETIWLPEGVKHSPWDRH